VINEMNRHFWGYNGKSRIGFVAHFAYGAMARGNGGYNRGG